MPRCPLKKTSFSYDEYSTGRTITEQIFGECEGEECAWFHTRYAHCSIVDIAINLDEIRFQGSGTK